MYTSVSKDAVFSHLYRLPPSVSVEEGPIHAVSSAAWRLWWCCRWSLRATHLSGRCSSHFHRQGSSPARCGASWLSGHLEHTDGGTHTGPEGRGEATSDREKLRHISNVMVESRVKHLRLHHVRPVESQVKHWAVQVQGVLGVQLLQHSIQNDEGPCSTHTSTDTHTHTPNSSQKNLDLTNHKQ